MIVIERDALAEEWNGVVESVTMKATVLVPEAVGVPEMAPAVVMVRPPGKPVADQV